MIFNLPESHVSGHRVKREVTEKGEISGYILIFKLLESHVSGHMVIREVTKEGEVSVVHAHF
jgi:hypothetical protein